MSKTSNRNPASDADIIRKETLWNSIGNFIYLASQWLLFYFVIKLIGYNDAGIFSLAMAVGGSLYLVASYSLRNYQASDLSAQFSVETYIYARVGTCILSFLICIVFLWAVGYPTYTAFCIIAYMIFKLSEAFSDVYQGILQVQRQMEYIGKAYLIKSLLDTGIFFITLFLARSMLLSICALALVSWLEVIGYERKTVLHVLKEEPSLEFSANNDKARLSNIYSLLAICLPIAICGFSTGSIAQIPRVFLEWQMGEEMLGIYSSIAIPIVLLQTLCSYIFTPLIVALTKYYNHNKLKQFTLLLVKALFGVLIIAAIAFAVFALLGKQIMGLLFGSSIMPFLYLMYPLLVSGVLVAMFWFLITLLTIVRELKSLLLLSLLSFALVLIGSQFAIERFGMNGATFIYILALVVFIVGGCIILGMNLSKRAKRSA